MTDSSRLLRVLEETGAILTGHFLLSSGKHSDRYVEKFNLLRQPAETEIVCRGFVDRFGGDGVELVVGPTTGGILLAFEVARQMRLPAAYAERASDGSLQREFRRGTTFTPGTRVLVVDDILTTGGSVRETIAALEAQDVRIVGIGVLVDRSGGKVQFPPYPLYPLVQMDVRAWEPEECPLCAAGVDLVKPGTTKV